MISDLLGAGAAVVAALFGAVAKGFAPQKGSLLGQLQAATDDYNCARLGLVAGLPAAASAPGNETQSRRASHWPRGRDLHTCLNPPVRPLGPS